MRTMLRASCRCGGLKALFCSRDGRCGGSSGSSSLYGLSKFTALRTLSCSVVPQFGGRVANPALLLRGRRRPTDTGKGDDAMGGMQQDLARQEQQQLIASENDDDVMRGAVMAAEAAAAGTIDAEDPTAVVDGQLQRPALVAEFLSGCSLGSAIKRRADFLNSDLVLIKVALDAARGMEYCHTKQLVHWNLKPGNLIIGFVDKVPHCKLSDLGTIKPRAIADMDEAGVSRVLPWTAPELLFAPTTATDKVDIYSYGMILWSMWTRKLPYEGQDVSRLLLRILQGRIVRPPLPGCADWDRLFTGKAPSEPAEGWRDLLERCWVQDPQQRPDFTDVTVTMLNMFKANKIAKRAAREKEKGQQQQRQQQPQQQQQRQQSQELHP
mmetsp:Transcript_7524/g.18193  ORF Transcript_7524/g.18193 Transcript_7524/m.18193 type:complete len:381 (-) Transcript_7524:1333-2475(-)